jgi:hypothetical protein
VREHEIGLTREIGMAVFVSNKPLNPLKEKTGYKTINTELKL